MFNVSLIKFDKLACQIIMALSSIISSPPFRILLSLHSTLHINALTVCKMPFIIYLSFSFSFPFYNIFLWNFKIKFKFVFCDFCKVLFLGECQNPFTMITSYNLILPKIQVIKFEHNSLPKTKVYFIMFLGLKWFACNYRFNFNHCFWSHFRNMARFSLHCLWIYVRSALFM